MLRFLLGRLVVLIPTFIGVSIIAFSFIRLLPGDPVLLMSGERVMAPERYQRIMHELGYDRPLVIQYLDYLGGILHGDFGNSIVTKQPVLGEFFTLFPATLELSLCAMLIAVALGIPAGVIAAVKRGSVFDQARHGRSRSSAIRCRSSGGACCSSSSSPASCMDAGLRPHLAPLLLPAGHRLHADRHPALRPDGRLQLGGAAT